MLLLRSVTQQPTTWPWRSLKFEMAFLDLVRTGFAGDLREIALHVGDLVLVGLGVDAGVDDDLGDLRHLVLVFVTAALHEFRGNLLDVEFLSPLERSSL